jgi:hypothetical protein
LTLSQFCGGERQEESIGQVSITTTKASDNQLQRRRKVLFWFMVSQVSSMVTWPCCFQPVARHIITVGNTGWNRIVCLMELRSKREGEEAKVLIDSSTTSPSMVSLLATRPHQFPVVPPAGDQAFNT